VKGAEILTTIAQLAVAVTGFSGIAIAFKREPGGLTGFEAFRISILFANSLAAVFLALIPFAFFHLGWSEPAIWRTASGILAIFEITFLASHVPSARRFLRSHRQLFNLKLLTFVTAGHVINTVAQCLNSFGVTRPQLSVFLFGLLWLLFHSIFQFGRILFVQPLAGGAMSSSRSEDKDRHHSP
jgi:hypothetical protein